MDRWTNKALSETDDITFAIEILDERARKVCPYSPLALKIKQTQATLHGLRATDAGKKQTNNCGGGDE